MAIMKQGPGKPPKKAATQAKPAAKTAAKTQAKPAAKALPKPKAVDNLQTSFKPGDYIPSLSKNKMEAGYEKARYKTQAAVMGLNKSVNEARNSVIKKGQALSNKISKKVEKSWPKF